MPVSCGSEASSRAASTTKKLAFLLVGCGQMSRGWLNAVRSCFADRLAAVAFVDLQVANAKARAGEYDLDSVHVGDSLEAALAATRPDVVFNCTIPEAHASTCIAALKAGAHVLVEKPLAPTVAEGRAMIAAAEAAGKILAVIQNRRYLAAGESVRRALREGVVGKIHTMCVDFFVAPRFGGFREEIEHPLLLDMAIHTFDQARHLSGLDAQRVYCQEFNPKGSWYARGASATAIFEMTGGVTFVYRGSWCAQGLPTSWQGAWRIIGDKGTLLWDGENQITVEKVVEPYDGKSFYQPVEQQTVPPLAFESSYLQHAGNIREFLDGIANGRPPQTVATDNVRSLSMVESAIASAKAGLCVNCD